MKIRDLGNLLRDIGDWFYSLEWLLTDYVANALYATARRLGARMAWPPRRVRADDRQK